MCTFRVDKLFVCLNKLGNLQPRLGLAAMLLLKAETGRTKAYITFSVIYCILLKCIAMYFILCIAMNWTICNV